MSGYLRNDVLLDSTRFLYSKRACTCASSMSIRFDILPPSSIKANPMRNTSEYFQPLALQDVTNFMGIDVVMRTGTQSLSNSIGRLIVDAPFSPEELNRFCEYRRECNKNPSRLRSVSLCDPRQLCRSNRRLPCVNPPSFGLLAYQSEIFGDLGAFHSTFFTFPSVRFLFA